MSTSTPSQPQGLVAQFQRSVGRQLPVAMVLLLATAGAAEAQRQHRAPAASVEATAPAVDAEAETPVWPNQSTPAPRSSHRPAVRLQLNITENTLTWIDAEGGATDAPSTAELARRAPITVVGTFEGRYGMHPTREELLARAAEPTRIFHSERNAPEVNEAVVVIVRGAPGDPLGFPDYPRASGRVGMRYATGTVPRVVAELEAEARGLTPHQVTQAGERAARAEQREIDARERAAQREATARERAATAAQRERENARRTQERARDRERERIRDRAASMPERIVTSEVEHAVTRAESAIRRKVRRVLGGR